MATTFADGVILGADSRTTSGAYIVNRVTDKVAQLTDTIWCCRSGSSADTQAVTDIVAYHLSMYESVFGEKPSTKTAAAIFQELLYGNRDMLTFVNPLTSNLTSLSSTDCNANHPFSLGFQSKRHRRRL